ncbi:MAG: apolipoprotein N-acyltransferase [Planctomycetaceae bacterium]|nr:apolipoprotein N-acyltransferase [Planctomycetaceae bacterium]
MVLHRNRTKAAGSAIAAPPEIFQPRLRLRRRLSIAALAFLTPALMVLSQPPLDAWYVAYVAMVPWLMAIVPGRMGRWQLLCATLAGLLFWLVNMHWISWITLEGYLAGTAYLSLYWLAAALLLRAAMRRGLAMWIVLPVVWTALEYVRANVIEFPWFLMGQTQYRQVRLIQIADITGQYGLTFFVAMVNGALLDLLNSPLFVRKDAGGGAVRRSILTGAVVSLAALALLLGYGTWRLNQATTSAGPVVGVVQEAVPIALEMRGPGADRIFEQHLNRSRELESARCDLVIWPETMLPMGLNDGYLDLARHRQAEWTSLNRPERAAFFAAEIDRLGRDGRAIAEASARLGCPILAGGTTVFENPADAGEAPLVHNSALWFDRSPLPSQQYEKMHLVPFGEAVPFADSWPWLHRQLKAFVPGSMSQIDPGQTLRVFTLQRGDKRWNIVSPICFEGTIPDVCRKMVMPQGRKIPNLVMANLSNDGWFVYQRFSGRLSGHITEAQGALVTAVLEGTEDVKIGTLLQVHRGQKYVALATVVSRQGQSLTARVSEPAEPPAAGDELSRTIGMHASTEQAQHLAHYFFRAVENRVPVVRAVNTGISAAIDSNGRLLGEVSADGRKTMVCGTMVFGPGNAGEKVAQRGGEILVDNRVSVYSRFGDVFAWATCLTGAALVVWLAWKRLRRSEEISG